MSGPWFKAACAVVMATLAWAAPPAALAQKNTPPTVTLTSPSNGAAFNAPATITLSATAADANGSVTSVSFYRGGTTLIATVTAAPYTYTWTNVAAGSYSITAKATDNGGASTTSTAATVSVLQPPPPPTITIPANGSLQYFQTQITGTFTGTAETTIIASNGVDTVLGDVNGTSYTIPGMPLKPGVNTLTVTAVQRDGTSSSSSVNVTWPVLGVVVTAPPKDSIVVSPGSVTFQASAQSIPAGVARVEYHNSIGGVIGSSTTPPYSVTWVNPPVGWKDIFAYVFDTSGRSEYSQRFSFQVRAPNKAPSVSLTAPANGAFFMAPANITLQAAASDPDGGISLVEFLQDGQLLGGTNVAPYSFAATNVPAGTYTFTARATDDTGAVTTSAPVSVSVSPSTPPAVNLTSPAEGSTFYVPANVTLTATASQPNGSITKVEFYAGETLIGTATSAPYTVTWAVTAGGTYSVTAKAYDNFGASVTSSAVAVTATDGVTYLHNDFAGNPIAASDSTGATLWKESYKPYGERLRSEAAAQNNLLWFHQKAADAETGLVYFGARYYDPTLGRFQTTDPLNFQEENLHSFNRYAYGNNNPMTFVDPDGYAPKNILSVDTVNRLYRGRGISGHHPFTREMAVHFRDVMTPEAINFVSQQTLGPQIIWDKNDPKNPHKWDSKPEYGHPQYNKDAIKIAEKYIEKNGISESKPMTVRQAAELERQLRRLEFNRRVQEYVDSQRSAGKVKYGASTRGPAGGMGQPQD